MGRKRRRAAKGVTSSMGMPLDDEAVAGDGHDEAAVHDHAAKGDHAEDAEDAEIETEYEVAEDGAGEAPRDAEEDDEGVLVAAQEGGHDGEDGEERCEEAPAELGQGLALLALLALEGVAEAGVGGEDLGEVVFGEGGEDGVPGGVSGVTLAVTLRTRPPSTRSMLEGGGGRGGRRLRRGGFRHHRGCG